RPRPAGAAAAVHLLGYLSGVAHGAAHGRWARTRASGPRTGGPAERRRAGRRRGADALRNHEGTSDHAAGRRRHRTLPHRGQAAAPPSDPRRRIVRGLNSTSTVGAWLRHAGMRRRLTVPVPVAERPTMVDVELSPRTRLIPGYSVSSGAAGS